MTTIRGKCAYCGRNYPELCLPELLCLRCQPCFKLGPPPAAPEPEIRTREAVKLSSMRGHFRYKRSIERRIRPVLAKKK